MRLGLAAAFLSLVTGQAVAQAPLPFDIEPRFSLVDQHGETRTEKSADGVASLLFFGYARCQAICSVVLPRMAEAVSMLEERGITVQPLLITVDPARDTAEELKEAAPLIHPRLIALTGSEDALADARKSFQVESELIGEDIEGPIYAHGSFVYLLAPDGKMLTLLPPILGPDRMVEISEKYLSGL